MKHQAVLLATEEISCIGRPMYDLEFDKDGFDPHVVHTYNLYVLSEDEVKVGDYYFSDGKTVGYSIHLCDSKRLEQICKEHGAKKVIFSSDESLGLPIPDDESLKLYCANPTEYVDVKYHKWVIDEKTDKVGYTDYEVGWIPKISYNNTISFKPVVEEESWDSILNTFTEESRLRGILGFKDWLKENYNPPQRKQTENEQN